MPAITRWAKTRHRFRWVVAQAPEFGQAVSGKGNRYSAEIAEQLGDRVIQQAIATSWRFVATKPGRDHVSLEEAHRDLRIAPDEFDAVARQLAASLDAFQVPQREKDEVLAAFAAHKGEVTEGSRMAAIA